MVKKGRPPKNSIDYIRPKVLMTAIKIENPKLTNGYQLELFFEPERFQGKRVWLDRKCNFDRYCEGAMPSKTWKIAIKRRFLNTLKYYDSLLWDAVRSSDQNWTNFYLRVNDELRSICYQIKSISRLAATKEREQKQKAIDKLLRVGTEESLACLIAIYREMGTQMSDFDSFHYLSCVITYEVYWLLSCSSFYEHAEEIHDYLKSHIFFEPKDSPYPILNYPLFELTAQQSKSLIFRNQNILKNAKKLKIVKSTADEREFIFLLYQGDQILILSDMAKLGVEPEFQLSREKYGLRWLKNRMKKKRKFEKNKQMIMREFGIKI